MRKVPTIKHIVARLENRFNDLTDFADMYHELVTSQVPEGYQIIAKKFQETIFNG